MSDIQAILFDMDDTLIDWSEADPDWEKREREHLQRVFDYMEEAGHTLPVSVNHFCMTYRDQMMDAWESARETSRVYIEAEMCQYTHKQRFGIGRTVGFAGG
ncbi:MAG: hypothetical protein AAFR67_09080, partial [Chloroflexota bacterium]